MNLSLWDSMGSPLATANKAPSSVDVLPADHNDTQCTPVSTEDRLSETRTVPTHSPPPASSVATEFLPAGATNSADKLARQYWGILDHDKKWIGSGASWSAQFSPCMASNPSYTPAELSDAMDWAAADPFWGEKLKMKSDQSTPYVLAKLTTIMTKFRASLRPSTSTVTNQKPAQHAVSHYA